MRKLTTGEVIQQFREVHDNFYDYSKFVYGGNAVKGTIICPNHGEFEQRSDDHKRGRGCSLCKVESRILTHEEVIQQFRDKHGDFYDYSTFEYVNNRTKGIIICPDHGEFLQSADCHKSGRGCPRCATEKSSKNQTLSQDEVIQQFRDKHGDFYDYSKFVYVNNITKGIIICPIHGEFLQASSEHKRGNGCPRCAHEAAKRWVR